MPSSVRPRRGWTSRAHRSGASGELGRCAVDVAPILIDPRDVAGVTRGAGARGLELTVHIFPPKKVRDQINPSSRPSALSASHQTSASPPRRFAPRPDRSSPIIRRVCSAARPRSGDLRQTRRDFLQPRRPRRLFTARRDILRRVSPATSGAEQSGRRSACGRRRRRRPEPSKAGRLLVLVNPAAGERKGRRRLRTGRRARARRR